jgi:hypothetical protein
LNFPDTLRSADRVHAEAQAVLFDFLVSDIALAFTFLESADIAGSGSKHYPALIQQAEKALLTIRHFQDRIEDQQSRAQVIARAAQLESHLNLFVKTFPE